MKRNLLRAAMVAVVIRGSGALAASTTLVSTNDYYYTAPRSTNIAGRVMGENGDYSLVRYEDAAWITEAWYERLELGEGNAYQTNRWSFGALVRGEPWSWWEDTKEYWTNATLRTSAVSKEWEGNINKVLAAASDGAMTNRVRRMEAMLRGKLVSKAAITNAYAMLKGMDVVVKQVVPADTNSAQRVYEEKTEQWQDGEKIGEDTYTSTGRIDCAWLQREGWGYYERIKNLNEIETYEIKESSKYRYEGSGIADLEFWVRRKENWLRGAQTPRVVKAVHAWGRVELTGRWEDNYEGREYDEEGEYEVVCTSNVVVGTNATVLVDLGKPQWKGTKTDVNGDYLVYTVELKPAEVLATCVAAAPWLPSLSEVEAAASVPGIEHDGGIRWVGKSVGGYVSEVYLVIQLKPITSLQGW